MDGIENDNTFNLLIDTTERKENYGYFEINLHVYEKLS